MICKTIKECSKEVFNWISKQKEVNEESITDWTLYKANDLEPRIKYIEFDRFKEARLTGADFEMWIIDNSYNFKARIQAKRLRIGKDHYPSIAYANKYGLQIEKLIDNAKANGFRPFYAFYNNEQETSRCGMDIKDEGIYLACAEELYRDIILNPRTRISTNSLISKSTPFSCWFCCPLCDLKNYNGLPDYLKRYFDFKNNDDSNLGFENKIPNHILNLLEISNKNSSELTDIWIKENGNKFEDVKRLIVFDNRKKE